MDDRQFDNLARLVAQGTSRRSILRGVLGLGGALTGATSVDTVSSRTLQTRSTITTAPPPVCTPGHQFCGGQSAEFCCPPGRCFDGMCCPEPVTERCGDRCCSAGQCTAWGECCESGHPCGTACCPEGSTCGRRDNTDICCGGPSGGAPCGLDCCPTAEQCCDGECCAAGTICIGDERCCAPDLLCGGACCDGAGEQCCGDVCLQAGQCCADGDCDPSPSTCQTAFCDFGNTCRLNDPCAEAEPETVCCAGACVFLGDTTNCLFCGNVCGSGELCTEQGCVAPSTSTPAPSITTTTAPTATSTTRAPTSTTTAEPTPTTTGAPTATTAAPGTTTTGQPATTTTGEPCSPDACAATSGGQAACWTCGPGGQCLAIVPGQRGGCPECRACDNSQACGPNADRNGLSCGDEGGICCGGTCCDVGEECPPGALAEEIGCCSPLTCASDTIGGIGQPCGADVPNGCGGTISPDCPCREGVCNPVSRMCESTTTSTTTTQPATTTTVEPQATTTTTTPATTSTTQAPTTTTSFPASTTTTAPVATTTTAPATTSTTETPAGTTPEPSTTTTDAPVATTTTAPATTSTTERPTSTTTAAATTTSTTRDPDACLPRVACQTVQDTGCTDLCGNGVSGSGLGISGTCCTEDFGCCNFACGDGRCCAEEDICSRPGWNTCCPGKQGCCNLSDTAIPTCYDVETQCCDDGFGSGRSDCVAIYGGTESCWDCVENECIPHPVGTAIDCGGCNACNEEHLCVPDSITNGAPCHLISFENGTCCGGECVEDGLACCNDAPCDGCCGEDGSCDETRRLCGGICCATGKCSADRQHCCTGINVPCATECCNAFEEQCCDGACIPLLDCCDGKCIVHGGPCCNDTCPAQGQDPVCCEADGWCEGECLPDGTCCDDGIDCNGACCPENQCTSDGQRCCDASDEVCGPSCCDSTTEKCCNDHCVPLEGCCSDDACAGDLHCCEDGECRECCDDDDCTEFPNSFCNSGNVCDCDRLTCADFPEYCNKSFDNGCGFTVHCLRVCPIGECNPAGTACVEDPEVCSPGEDYCENPQTSQCGPEDRNCVCITGTDDLTYCMAVVAEPGGLCLDCETNAHCEDDEVCIKWDNFCRPCGTSGRGPGSCVKLCSPD